MHIRKLFLISVGAVTLSGSATDGWPLAYGKDPGVVSIDLTRARPIVVTTVEDVVDFAPPQTAAQLPGPDGRVSFREAVIASNLGERRSAGRLSGAFFGAEVRSAPGSGLLFALCIDGSRPLEVFCLRFIDAARTRRLTR